MNLWTAALLVFAINLPFGFWRAGTRKLSMAWFLAVHIPVPLAIAIRYFSEIGWQLSSYPILIAAFFGGQFFGGKIRKRTGSSIDK